MNTRARIGRDRNNTANERRFPVSPIARAVALALAAGGASGPVHAQQAFSPSWFSAKGAAQNAATTTGRLPNGLPAHNLARTEQQSRAARETLQHSIDNLGTAARALTLQQRLQEQGRAAARARPGVADGLTEGGLKVDTNPLTAGWINANDPTQVVNNDQTTVTIEQTGDKAILNWETFNVGRNTTVNFEQQASWSVLNRVNDPQARPSQIQGQIQSDGTVFLVNRNGILFDGSSQVNVRNLVAAAVNVTDEQFGKGIYGEAQGTRVIPSFANDLATTSNSFTHGAATGGVLVEQGARIATHAPKTVTEGGGYVLLLGADVSNAGQITTTNGQTVLAAGDAFVISKGVSTDANQTSTTRGNVVGVLRLPDGTDEAGEPLPNPSGTVRNAGLIQAATGDITLAGHDVRQDGTLMATTSVHVRGTIHLLNDKADATGQVTLGDESLTAIVLDESATTALDVQRETLVKDSDKAGDGIVHRRDQSLVQITTGGDVTFEGGSLTLATSGQVFVDAEGSSEVSEGAQIDVSGYVGAKIAMEANNVLINAQGNEQRDAPVSRDDRTLNNSNIWLDRRDLVLVPAGTNGYETDRWYTAGGLLEVGGYLGITGHGIGEWSAQGGTVQFSGGELVTRRGSSINLSGGTLDVQSGYVYQTWLKGVDGRLYNASTAPGDLLYTGLYGGFETTHSRWGSGAVDQFSNPLIAPERRLENGYTVGRDAGRLVVTTAAATLEGDVETTTFQGERQTRPSEAGLDSYQQAQTAVARNGELVIGAWTPIYDKNTQNLRFTPGAVAEQVVIARADAVPSEGEGGQLPEASRIVLDADWLNGLELGALRVYADGSIEVAENLTVTNGGAIALHATEVDVAADLTARGGRIALGNIVERRVGAGLEWVDSLITSAPLEGYVPQTTIQDGVTLDARGLWSNLQQDRVNVAGLAFVDGGNIEVRSSGNVAVGAGALLDASSGAALLADDSFVGGKGGDITLIAGTLPASGAVNTGQLTLGGELRSFGVKGGGTLRLQTGNAVVIGGQVAGSDGSLRAGEVSLVDLIAQEEFTIAAGAILPVDYHYTRTYAQPGETLGGEPIVDSNQPETWLTLSAPWTPPRPTAAAYWMTLSDGSMVFVRPHEDAAELPAGTVITRISGAANFPQSWIVPADVFQSGISIQPTAAVLRAGNAAPADVTFAAGTYLSAGTRLPLTVAVEAPLHVEADLFDQGFSRYEITGGTGVAVAEDARIDVIMPVLKLEPGVARGVLTGADPTDALTLWTPPLFAENPEQGRLSQRQGSDLQLTAGDVTSGRSPTLAIGAGSRISVDPGRNISLFGDGQTTIEGEMHAAGGSIDILGLNVTEFGSAQGHDRSIWIGERAVLDVSGQAHSALNTQGQRYGLVLDGGRIQIGGEYDADATAADVADRFIIVRPGARLDASGAAASLDLPQLGETLVASDGGLISLSSYNGLYLDGELRAAAGGVGAAGGTLALTLESPNYANSANPDARVRAVRELNLVREQTPEALISELRPGESDQALVYGHARLGVDRVAAGGFDNLSLLVNGLLTIEDGVDLHLGQSLRLTAGTFNLADGASEHPSVTLSAPHVRLAGATRFQKDHHTMPYPNSAPDGLPLLVEDSRLLVEAALLDVIEDVAFGTWGAVATVTGEQQPVQRAGFETVELRSDGDMRFLKSLSEDRTSLETVGDLVLAASQVYPATSARVEIHAGKLGYSDEWGNYTIGYDPSRSLRVERIGNNDPRVPFSAFGSLRLASANVDQAGVVRAPLGNITFGIGPTNQTVATTVLLRPGSITSASAAGLMMPYGGTVDGLTYVYDGRDVLYHGIGGGLGSIRLDAGSIEVQEGAVLDLSGGGELTGAGFLSGRGGSTDARLHPLVQMAREGGGFVLPGLDTNPVYAIVPGIQPNAAPIAAENGAGDPMIGQQITIGEGVPGLAAGTYTLLPSTYALLPGAFRVELNGLASSAVAFGNTNAMRDGSYATSARMSIAHTAITDELTTQAVLTPADTLRAYSQYNETSYAQFGLDWAARDSVPRPQLERDARSLSLAPGMSLDIARGAVRFEPAKSGRSGTVVLDGRNIEILADGAMPTEAFDGISVYASTLNDIGAGTIAIGATPISQFSATGYGSTQNAWRIEFGTGYDSADQIILREGAVLSASQVFLVTSEIEGGITLEQGAGIDTLGRGAASWDANDGYVIAPGSNGVLAVSNGWQQVLAPVSDASSGSNRAGNIHIGVCAEGSVCTGETRLYSEGTITAATDQSFVMTDSVRYGTRNLVLAVGGINVGSVEALADAAAGGILPSGLTLNQQVLERLLRGDTSTGAPALENLVLTARDSVNFFGSVSLSTLDPATGKSSLERLVLGAPAFYGHGSASDVARIETDTLVWNGALTPAGSVIAGGAGTGSGQLEIDARVIEFGYGPNSQPDTVNSQERLVLGFSGTHLEASERITANHKGTLSVYQSQGAWDEVSKAYTYSGGDLNISTPLLTGQAGSINSIRAGGEIRASAPEGSVSPLPQNTQLADALGAELSLHAGTNLTLDTSVLLPSGKLRLEAANDVVLADGAQLDLAGRKIVFYDVDKYSWGGEVVLQSHAGSIAQHSASHIDISADYNRAGRLTAIALGGTVDLAGTIQGDSSGYYDAGGTDVPFASGYVDVRGQQIADFAGLNARLSAGEVFGGRSFQLKQGDLVIGDELRAREINVSVDNGQLTVNGTIDASGEQAGSIRLAANEGVTIAGSAVLDASASVLRKDSYGQVIEAPNRAVVEIDSGAGRLVLSDGARIDVSVDDATETHGTVALNAPRIGGATGNDVDIDAGGRITISGAKSIAVNAFHSYDDAPIGVDPSVDGRSYQVIDQSYLDSKHLDSETFIDNALANGALMDGKLAGLRAYAEQFHLRPGVEIVSATSDGDLHVDGDIDLSGYRYASVNPHTQRTGVYGSGEAGALVLRAEGDLAIFGSISDGFDGSRLPVTRDDGSWVLPAGRMPFGGDLIVPHGGVVTLDVGTVFKAGRTLNYDLPMSGLVLPAGTMLPVAMTLGEALTLPAGTVLGAAVRDAGGNVLYAAGTVLQQPLQLDVGAQLDAGFRLSTNTAIAAALWPKGVPLPVDVTLTQQLALAKGAIVPSETDVVLPGGATVVNLRPADADGNQGRMWALAPMLSAGSQSADLRLVAGADLGAADSRIVNTQGSGALRLSDTHLAPGFERSLVPGSAWWVWTDDNWLGMPGGEPVAEADMWACEYALCVLAGNPVYEDVAKPTRQQLFSVLRTGTGDLDLVAGGDFDMTSPFGVYTAGTASPSLGAAYDQPRGRVENGTVLRPEGALFESLVDGGSASLYAAWYPEHGGNVWLRAQGDLKGDLIGAGVFDTRPQIASTAVGNWLWRQGTGSVQSGEEAVPTAWWINFGTYVYGGATGTRDDPNSNRFVNDPFLVGFTGIGTLGGGNLVVEAGGNAGIIDIRGNSPLNGQGQVAAGTFVNPRSQGLHLAVASTGRVTADGELVQTGGGDLDLRLGGSLNPNAQLRRNEHDLNSTFVNMRGATHVDAGAIGGVQLRYGTLDHLDTRSGNPFVAERAFAGGGPILVLGDSTVRIDTRGDLVLGGVADPGRTLLLNSSPFSYEGADYDGKGWSWFSLWTPATAIDLLSAGGNLTPTTAWAEGGYLEDMRQATTGRNHSSTLDGYFYPSILRATAANGSLFYGVGTTDLRNNFGPTPLRIEHGLTLAPSPQAAQFANVTGRGELQLLAADSIYASGFTITASTADPLALTNPFHPGFVGMVAETGGGPYGWDPIFVNNVAAQASVNNEWAVLGTGRTNNASLFTFASSATSAHAAQDQAPARYYALEGDIVGLRFGQIVELGFQGRDGERYEGSIPVAVRAGRDITDSGTPLGQKDTVAGQKSATGDARGNLIAHGFADDISVIEAGRDIRNSSFYIVGPGLLEVTAGRHLNFADNGEVKSLGPIVNVTPGDRSGGASIAVAAGMGDSAQWAAFAARYLDPDNQADPERPFADQPGKALYVYNGELTLAQWLQRELGYEGDAAGAESFLQQKQAELDAAREAALAGGLTAPNRSLAREYQQESQLHLVNWLSQRFGGRNGLSLNFDATTMDAREFFSALPAEQQRAYLRNVYYAELKAGGREYNDADGKRFGSYLRGREAIATLFPNKDSEGNALNYEGDLTLFSSALYIDEYVATNGVGKDRPTPGKNYISKEEWEALGRPGYGVAFYDVLDAGIHTNFGGDISILTPGGRTLVGIDGSFTPGAGSGVMTQGDGDINIYALDDILMGQSRIFTTFGGNILGWSAEGDINAGRGAKTTVVHTPQRLVYDSVGNVTLSPSTPSTGAGIATLNPIPEIPPGDIDLIAPLGTIDAGEAGIRVSGNVNLAALHVVNAENIQVQGEAMGMPVLAQVNVSALSNASQAASAAAASVQDVLQRERAAARQNLPSIFSVRVLGFGDERASTDATDTSQHSALRSGTQRSYDPKSPAQIVGLGNNIDPKHWARLTEDERRRLQQDR